jgi:hypothetical protein
LDGRLLAVGRLALVAFGLLLITCGSHVESDSARVDPLLALEKDPQAALTAAKHPTYKATYDMSFGSLLTPPSASPGMGFSSTQTYVARPPDFRWDFALSGAVQFRTIAIVRGAETFICLDGDTTGITGTLPSAPATAGCYTMPADSTHQMLDSLNVSPLDSMVSATKDMDVTVLPRERIANRDAACFRWRPRVSASASPSATSLNSLFAQLGDAKLEACFSADGVMLRTLTSAGALFSVEQRATSVTATVTDADFALPYPVSSSPFPIPTSAPVNPQTSRPMPSIPASPAKPQTPRPTPTR